MEAIGFCLRRFGEKVAITQARIWAEFVIMKRNSWSKDAEQIVHEMLGRTLWNVLVVAAKIRYEGTLK
jgi:hypothetical protein